MLEQVQRRHQNSIHLHGIKDVEMNVQTGARLTSFTVREGGQLKLYQVGQN